MSKLIDQLEAQYKEFQALQKQDPTIMEAFDEKVKQRLIELDAQLVQIHKIKAVEQKPLEKGADKDATFWQQMGGIFATAKGASKKIDNAIIKKEGIIMPPEKKEAVEFSLDAKGGKAKANLDDKNSAEIAIDFKGNVSAKLAHKINSKVSAYVSASKNGLVVGVGGQDKTKGTAWGASIDSKKIATSFNKEWELVKKKRIDIPLGLVSLGFTFEAKASVGLAGSMVFSDENEGLDPAETDPKVIEANKNASKYGIIGVEGKLEATGGIELFVNGAELIEVGAGAQIHADVSARAALCYFPNLPKPGGTGTFAYQLNPPKLEVWADFKLFIRAAAFIREFYVEYLDGDEADLTLEYVFGKTEPFYTISISSFEASGSVSIGENKYIKWIKDQGAKIAWLIEKVQGFIKWVENVASDVASFVSDTAARAWESFKELSAEYRFNKEANAILKTALEGAFTRAKESPELLKILYHMPESNNKSTWDKVVETGARYIRFMDAVIADPEVQKVYKKIAAKDIKGARTAMNDLYALKEFGLTLENEGMSAPPYQLGDTVQATLTLTWNQPIKGSFSYGLIYAGKTYVGMSQDFTKSKELSVQLPPMSDSETYMDDAWEFFVELDMAGKLSDRRIVKRVRVQPPTMSVK